MDRGWRVCAVLLVAAVLQSAVFVDGARAQASAATAPAARPGAPQGAAQGAEFDHLRTGFALTDRHAQARCESCHANGLFQGTPRDCASCHRAGMRLARGNVVMPARHVPTMQACDACHHTRTFAGARFSHAGVAPVNCLGCHNHAIAPGRPAAHLPTFAACESCHRSTSTWLAVSGGHSAANAVGTGTCDGCHNGVGARGKHPGHIPVPAGIVRCDGCHRSQTAFTSAVTMNHAAVATAECRGCHNGQYLGEGSTGALARPANHIPEAQLVGGALLDCKACHTNTTSWTAARMNHNGSAGNGAGWCKACHDSAARYGGPMERKPLRHEAASNVVVTDCSQAGCHRPLGNKGAAYTKWD